MSWYAFLDDKISNVVILAWLFIGKTLLTQTLPCLEVQDK